MHILDVHTRPGIIRTPGRLRIWSDVNITESLPPRLGVDMAVSKYLFGFPFKIPCFKNIGTW